MEKDCTPFLYPGWKGFDTIRCSYSVSDGKDGKQKSGLVIMLNPSAAQLSGWIIQACKNVSPDLDLAKCAEYLFKRVMTQSGGQFVVAGVVYEDYIPADHVFEVYAFRDGVNVVLNGIKHRRTSALSAAELESSLNTPPVRTVSDAAFARVTGTSRNEYRWANPNIDINGLEWLTVVRATYQKAYRSERNELLEEWLRNNPPK